MNVNRIDLTPVVLLVLIILVVFIMFGGLIVDNGLPNMNVFTNQSELHATNMLTAAPVNVQATVQVQDMQATQAAVERMRAEVQTTQTAIADMQAQIQATQTAVEGIQTQVQATQTAVEEMRTQFKATQTAVANMQSQVNADAQKIRATQTTWEDARAERERMHEQTQKDAMAFAEAALYYILPFALVVAVITVAILLKAGVTIKKKEAEAQRINAHRKLREYREKQKVLAAAAVSESRTSQFQSKDPHHDKRNSYIWPVQEEARPEVGHEVR